MRCNGPGSSSHACSGVRPSSPPWGRSVLYQSAHWPNSPAKASIGSGVTASPAARSRRGEPVIQRPVQPPGRITRAAGEPRQPAQQGLVDGAVDPFDLALPVRAESRQAAAGRCSSAANASRTASAANSRPRSIRTRAGIAPNGPRAGSCTRAIRTAVSTVPACGVSAIAHPASARVASSITVVSHGQHAAPRGGITKIGSCLWSISHTSLRCPTGAGQVHARGPASFLALGPRCGLRRGQLAAERLCKVRMAAGGAPREPSHSDAGTGTPAASTAVSPLAGQHSRAGTVNRRHVAAVPCVCFPVGLAELVRDPSGRGRRAGRRPGSATAIPSVP
jgi:hypothetical protein